jgi:hypothetical protein
VPLSAVTDTADSPPEETVYEVYREPALEQKTGYKSHGHVSNNCSNHMVNDQNESSVSVATRYSSAKCSEEMRGSPTWCKCGECSRTDDTGKVCCAKTPELRFLFENKVQCVTETLLFSQVVLSKSGLKYGDWVGKRWLLSQENGEDSSNRAYRHLAYNTFVNLVSSHLREEWSHKVLPSCVVNAIRRVYPSADGVYSGIVRST